MQKMNYDTFAHVYNFFEKLLFGKKLERARFEFLNELRYSKEVLIFGEGDGRFLERLIEFNSTANITVVEISEQMISRSKKRLHQSEKVTFLNQNALSMEIKESSYDAIITHFFLDNFLDKPARC